MRMYRMLVSGGLTAAAVLLPTVGALAASNVDVIEAVKPTIAPGDTEVLNTAETTCPNDLTFAGTVEGTSWTFTLTKGTMSLVGFLKIPADAKPGTYTATGKCPTGGKVVSGTFTVTGMAPQGAAHTGLGGGSGMNGAEVAAGGALALAAGASGVVLLRRRRT
ncbi:hypothetical protein [Kitasatospora sp. NPDC093558]|uniref:hypothetical protein n=1 Tax=Kitasatospora sp. NPDC093558 TaxID=3155201 RepID=UPI00341904DC